MATILLTDCTTTANPMQGMNFWTIVTPATADAADTVDVSDLILDANIYAIRVACATDGLVAGTATVTGVVHLSGTTNNEARTVYIWGKSA